jgi:hypothetical protein
MEPTLVEGQGLIGLRSGRARIGQLRVFEHPRRAGFWLVKRVAACPDEHTMRVEADNPEAGGVDSRTFGDVAVAGSYRVLLAVPRRLMGPGVIDRGDRPG